MLSGHEVHDLIAAKQGDKQLFDQLIEKYRPELLAHCYRMLGSVQDAEDTVQETMLRAWRALPGYEARAAFRAWLYKIATNASLDLLDKQARRTLPVLSFPPADPRQTHVPALEKVSWIEPYPDHLIGQIPFNPEARYTQKESVRLAFLVALQTLPPRQRAVLILRDVLAWRAKEIAEHLEMTVSAVNSALHRARRTLENHVARPKFDQAPADPATEDLLVRYVQAWETADIRGLVALLKEDAAFAMPPSPSWYQGRSDIGTFLAASLFRGEKDRWHLVPTRANGLPAFGLYEWGVEEELYAPSAIQIVRAARTEITEVITFLTPSIFQLFQLPGSITRQSP